MYIYERKDWPAFRWDDAAPGVPLAAVRHRQGRLIGRMEALGFPLRSEALLQTLTEDVVKSSEIEGEALDKEQVRSSIARRLGIDIGALAAVDRSGIATLRCERIFLSVVEICSSRLSAIKIYALSQHDANRRFLTHRLQSSIVVTRTFGRVLD